MGDRAEPLSSSDQQPMKPIRYLKDGVLRKKFLNQVNWVGEKLLGKVFFVEPASVAFCYRGHDRKPFTFKKHGGLEGAFAAARAYQHKICHLRGWVRNEYGFFIDKNGNEIGVVKLSKGKFMLFDRKHLSIVTKYTWRAWLHHGNWYAVAYIQRKTVRFHRWIMSDIKMIDHWDHEGTNNLIANLKSTDGSRNQLNGRKKSNNTSGEKDVFYDRCGNRWRAVVTVNDVTYRESFSVDELGNDGARNAAIAARNTLCKTLGVFSGVDDYSDDEADTDEDDNMEDLLDVMLPLEKA